MRIQGARAFVLHARRWRETSLLVEVLSLEHGRLGLAARGVQTPKRHALRAALQPLQHITFDAVLRGELATLTRAEALDAAPLLTGPALLSGFYVNELLLRLLARQDPHPDLYAAYAQVRVRLGTDEPLGWSLRRFERDLLQALGLGLDYATDGDGAAIDPAARYQLDPEHGARRVPQHAAQRPCPQCACMRCDAKCRRPRRPAPRPAPRARPPPWPARTEIVGAAARVEPSRSHHLGPRALNLRAGRIIGAQRFPSAYSIARPEPPPTAGRRCSTFPASG